MSRVRLRTSVFCVSINSGSRLNTACDGVGSRDTSSGKGGDVIGANVGLTQTTHWGFGEGGLNGLPLLFLRAALLARGLPDAYVG